MHFIAAANHCNITCYLAYYTANGLVMLQCGAICCSRLIDAASGANASISLPSGYPNALTGAYLYRGVLTHQPNEWAVIYAASSYLFIRAQESSNKLSTAPMLCY